MGFDTRRIIYDFAYNSDYSGGWYPLEGIARLWGLCCKGKISIAPKDMVDVAGNLGEMVKGKD